MRRPGKAWALRAAVVACLVAAAVVARTGSAASVSGVAPFLDCVAYFPGQNELTGLFGYTSSNDGDVSIPVGTQNVISPAPDDQGQPTTFSPGTNHSVFSVSVHLDAHSSISWTLLGQTATATNDPNEYCNPQPVPPGPDGPQGPQGSTGATGPTGPTGSAGPSPAGPTGATGPVGPTGMRGPTGAAGPAGPAGSSGFTRIAGDPVSIGPSHQVTALVTCPVGDGAIGGGFETLGPASSSPALQLFASYPSGRSWVVTVANPYSGAARPFRVDATCAIAG